MDDHSQETPSSDATVPQVEFACPECCSALVVTGTELRCGNAHRFVVAQGVYHLLPASVSPLALEDAHYHGAQKESWIEQSQVGTYRNTYFHRSVLGAIAAKSTSASNILEIGGGVGFDLSLFLAMKPQFRSYVFSEISSELVADVAARLGSSRIVCCTVDAQHLPFPDDYFDCVFMMATLHHLQDTLAALRELVRVTRAGGLVCCGMEPNAWWLRLLASTKSLWRGLLPRRSHSPADEEADGLGIRELHRIGESVGLRVGRLEPVWFLSGFAHYGLEFLFRLLRLKQRIRLPLIVERILVDADRLLLKLPGLRHLSWHYSVIYEKPG
jgi:SAM-dependent methyltransferase